MERFWAKVDKTPGYGPTGDCWLWTAYRNKDGYGQFGVGSAIVPAHRYAWANANGRTPEGYVVRHSCDNPPCCNPNHLLLGTQADNVRDRDQRKRGCWSHGVANGAYTKPECRPRGSVHGRALITEEQVLEIRALYAAGGWSHKRLGLRFGLSETQTGRILRCEQWKHV